MTTFCTFRPDSGRSAACFDVARLCSAAKGACGPDSCPDGLAERLTAPGLETRFSATHRPVPVRSVREISHLRASLAPHPQDLFQGAGRKKPPAVAGGFGTFSFNERFNATGRLAPRWLTTGKEAGGADVQHGCLESLNASVKAQIADSDAKDFVRARFPLLAFSMYKQTEFLGIEPGVNRVPHSGIRPYMS